MKVTIFFKNCGVEKEKFPLVNQFIKYLQEHYPLKNDVEINFLGKRIGNMTTGSRQPGLINVFCRKRIMRDILRSLAHEWFHEYEDIILKIPHKQHIGGKNENLANSESGKIIKKFEAQFSEIKELLYT
jgi:hypothetical protein